MEAQRPLGFQVVSLTIALLLPRDAPRGLVLFRVRCSLLGLALCNFRVSGSHGGGIGAG